MLLKDFIAILQEIHKRATEDPVYFSMMGEPSIYIEHYAADDPFVGVHPCGYGDVDYYLEVDGSTVIVHQKERNETSPLS